MRILYLNPNSTVAMTQSILAGARSVLPPEVELLGWTNAEGPEAIQGPEDGARAVPGLLSQLGPARAAGVDAMVIACFDDTGLSEMQAAAHCPVLGIGQAAYATAGLLGRRFSVVTTLAVSVPVIAENIVRLGHGAHCTGLRPTGLPVLAVEAGGRVVMARILEEIAAAAREDGAEAAVLGCAGMTGLAEALAARAALPVIDGVRASAALAHAMARLAQLQPGLEASF